MARRLHTPHLQPGTFELPRAEAHHARDVLRLTRGELVELFDDAGRSGEGELIAVQPDGVTVRVEKIREEASTPGTVLTIAAAVPKGDRADWMIEKLSEIGVSRFVPLAATRSVTLPEGKNKRERWVRIATEAAKQSRRVGVMRIDELTPVKTAIAGVKSGCCLSTDPGSRPLAAVIQAMPETVLTLFIGPEGGWTADELAMFASAGLTAVGLTDTILRVETAAVAAAAVVMCFTKTGIA